MQDTFSLVSDGQTDLFSFGDDVNGDARAGRAMLQGVNQNIRTQQECVASIYRNLGISFDLYFNIDIFQFCKGPTLVYGFFNDVAQRARAACRIRTLKFGGLFKTR